MKICVNKILYDYPDIDVHADVKMVKNLISAGDCDYYFGSIEECRRVLSSNDDTMPKVDYGPMPVNKFLPLLSDDALNCRGGYYKDVCQLNLLDVGMFCRSDSGDKLWSGQILTEGMIDIIKDIVCGDTVLFLAPPKTIEPIEYRCWVEEDRLIACGAYNVDLTGDIDIRGHHIPDKTIDEIESFIKKICKRFIPCERYVIDLCVCNKELKVVEYNCFSTSGFANADCLRRVTNYIVGKFA